MWNKPQTATEAPTAPPPQATPPSASAVSFGSPSAPRSITPGTSGGRSSARLGSSLHINGQISGAEDLQIDGQVDGPITLNGHQLIVGASAVLNSEVHSGEVIVYGKVIGNVYTTGRVDIKTDGSVIGDISTSRISIEDGAHFKGRIEIDPAKAQAAAG
ncbi:MAG TPA: polymer-forming cytoskeletal protein [Candidatus Solibacter sp.]|nr:polymer-forming cytoskeletal protein [Candidatus Solibacter sp.]